MRKGALPTVTTFPVTTRLDGSAPRIWVQEVKGEHDGPTPSFVSTQHGAEWFSVEIMRRVITELVPAKLRGRVIGVPVANPVALGHFHAHDARRVGRAGPDRVWPCGPTWIAEQIAAALDQHLFRISGRSVWSVFGLRTPHRVRTTGDVDRAEG